MITEELDTFSTGQFKTCLYFIEGQKKVLDSLE